ncbi:MAG TPA: copper chaperone PCu(A)C [Bauldia sp.]|nr:copper chaperone PCu(A)C [Bauldia sp.]
MRLKLVAAGLWLALASPALAAPVTVGSLAIDAMWTRATPPGAPSAGGYLTITNTGSEADTLTAVASPMAGMSDIHVMETKDGVMTMHGLEGGLPIPAGGTVTLAPGGFHIMFIGLTGALKQGDTLPVTLTFAKAGKVDVALPVLAIGARGP